MFCLIYYFLPIFLKISLGPSLKHFPSISHFPQDEVSPIHWAKRGAEVLHKKKAKGNCKWVNEVYYLATWFDSIYNLEFRVMQYPMTASSLLCLTGTCPVHYTNVCWYCWSTHWATHVPFALRKWMPFLPQQDPFWLLPTNPFSVPHISWFLTIESARGKGSFGKSVLQPAQSQINAEFRPCCSGLYPLRCWKSVGTDFSQPLWATCFRGWLSPWVTLHSVPAQIFG